MSHASRERHSVHPAALAARRGFDIGRRERLFVLGGMVALVTVAFALGMAFTPEATLELGLLIPASFFAAGKFLPLWGISGQSTFGPYALGLVIWGMDTFTVLLIVYGLAPLYRVRPLRRILDRIQTNASLVLAAYPRFRRGAVIGVCLFVLFPIAGTGALVGAFIGTLLGMNRHVLILAVSVGGCLGGLLMATVAVHFGNAVRTFQALQQEPIVKVILVGSVIVFLALIVFAVTRMYRRALAQAAAEQPLDP